MSKNILPLAKQLISIPSTADNYYEILRIFNRVEKYFAHEKVLIKKYNFSQNKKPSLLITLQKTLRPRILLYAHLDVVPADKSQFIPKVRSEKLFGRGAADMKSAAAVYIELIKYFSKKNVTPSLGLILTSDEEIGGREGAGYLVKKRNIRSDVVIMADGGKNFEEIQNKNKGICRVHLEATGRSGHGAAPWSGENAIDLLIDAYKKIQKIFSASTKKQPWKTSCGIGIIHGGHTANMIPDKAEADLDIRYTETDSVKEILRKIQMAAPELNVTLKYSCPLSVTRDKDPYLQSYISLTKDIIGSVPKLISGMGANDGRYFTPLGIPVIISRPTSGGAHTDCEWVHIHALSKYYNLLKGFIEIHGFSR